MKPESKEFFVEQGIIDLRSLVFQNKLAELYNVTDLISLQMCHKYKFNRRKLSRTSSGMLKMLKAARLDSNELKVISNVINS